jgi:hypothetical protein
MKNIHVLKTPNPSRLYEFGGIWVSHKEPTESFRNYNIYITNDVEIKDGDWMIRGNEQPTLVTPNFFWDFGVRYYKIILTTDPTLIADGVQAIDDEFLEWFVKNPSCEFVEVGYGWIRLTETNNEGYWVSIPDNQYEMTQEEPKQIKCYDMYNQVLSEGDYVDVQKDGVQLIYKKEDNQLYFKPYGKEHRVSTYFSNDLAKCDEVGNWINNDRYEDIVEKPKQETIEEREPYWDIIDKKAEQNNRIDLDAYANGVQDGVKWQAEKMYIEAIEFAEWIRIKDFQTTSKNNWIGLDMRYYTTEELFEQFKKK